MVKERTRGGVGLIMKAAQRGPDLFLRNSRDIEWVKQGGQRVATALFNMHLRRSEQTDTRLCIIVGRRFGTAVRRNRAKRLFRELARTVRDDLRPGYRFLIFPKSACLTTAHGVLRAAWIQTLQRHGLLKEGAVS